MSKLRDHIEFSATELKMAAELKSDINKDLSEELETENMNIVVEISFGDNENVRWGHVYADADAEGEAWRVIETAKDNFAHRNGFPDTLIDVLPA